MNDNVDLALLVIRVVFGLTLMAHGAQKLFGAFGGPGIDGFAGWLASMGIRQPRMASLAAGLGEFGGGLLFALGLLTPLAALLITTVMLVAILTVHWKAGFFSTDGGYEFNLAIITAAFAVTLTGAGGMSLDDAFDIATDINGWQWAVGMLIVAAILASGALLGRSTAPAKHDGGATPVA
jgi:putative oxidoreductase